jgi:anti-sigma regulatory factor (Ser/Thr protein kinase)
LALRSDGHRSEVSIVQIVLTPGPESARAARSWLTPLLGSWRSDVARDNAMLVLTEIVTNAVRHAGGRTVLITVTLTRGHLLAEVHDESATLPVRRGASEAGGWGLGLIDRLSNHWGVDKDGGGGKTVWFDIDDANPYERPGFTS